MTDANLVLGRVIPEFFPKIFGPNEDEALDYDGARAAFIELTQVGTLRLLSASDAWTKQINEESGGRGAKSVEEV